ncbi:hypothetical protein ACMD2_08264 [Ananas comosus]|uniref:BED-type domain-containing protein n=1 Tax=Ananas comosus TaxID=4615 RepID=A0A199VM26_ANACO|nr:hypothetical protein ACMD2_08264 [Ananas comosus]
MDWAAIHKVLYDQRNQGLNFCRWPFGVNSNIIMVREKDVCWEYCEKMDGNKVRCKFCQKVLNGGISRLKFHLSRLPSKGVHPCSKSGMSH